MYSVAASSDPDRIECVVPWRINNEFIFFGPCKKRIRENMRKKFTKNSNKPNDIIYIVGVNGSNFQQVRKIVFCGEVIEVMTFAEAYHKLYGEEYEKLRNHRMSPLHLKPIYEREKLIGYEHVSLEHIQNDAWVSDVISHKNIQNVIVEDRIILLKKGTPEKIFDRDCCMLLRNLFFASGKGIRFDNMGLSLLRDAQPQKANIDNYAVFGRTKNGHANGLRGTYLEIIEPISDRFIEWIDQKVKEIGSQDLRYEPSKTCCS